MAEVGEAVIARSVAEFMAECVSVGGGGGGGSGGGSSSSGSGVVLLLAMMAEMVKRARVRLEDSEGHREDAQRMLASLLKGVESAAGGELSGLMT